MIRTGVDALVLDGSRRGALAVVRSLGRAGYQVGLEGTVVASRFASAKVRLPDPRVDRDAYTSELLASVDAMRPDVVMTASDWGLEALNASRMEISRVAAPAMAADGPLSVATSKQATMRLATSLGIPTPRSVDVRDHEDVVSAAAELGYPCVVKPDVSWRRAREGEEVYERVGSVLLRSQRDIAAADGLARRDAPATVQEYVPGRREAVMVFLAGGSIKARFAMTASRCWPPLGGSSVMRTSIPLPEYATAYAELLVQTISLEGYSEVEFRRSATGRPVLMEINPRFSESIELALMSGVPFGSMQLEWARGGRLPASNGYNVGKKLSWPRGELYLLGASLFHKKGSTTRFSSAARAVASDYVRLPRLDGVAVDDPAPMVRSVMDAVVGDPIRVLKTLRQGSENG
jgi:predicted ATP-grasp superfamily ATP-dependent carboligase